MGAAATADFEIWEGLDRIPPVVDGELPQPVDELYRMVSEANGMLITAPAHSTLPVQLSNALGWLSSPRAGAILLGKPVGVVTACLRPHEAMWTQTHLRRALGAAGAIVYGADLAVSSGRSRFDATGKLADKEFRGRFHKVLDELCSPSLAKART
ncbi:NADPH-dependent FMN reductase [Streptosporangium lutulentum]